MNNLKQKLLTTKRKNKRYLSTRTIKKSLFTDLCKENIAGKKCNSSEDIIRHTHLFNDRVEDLLSRWENTHINSLDDCKKLRSEIDALVDTFIMSPNNNK